jgi:hypothetical protein
MNRNAQPPCARPKFATEESNPDRRDIQKELATATRYQSSNPSSTFLDIAAYGRNAVFFSCLRQNVRVLWRAAEAFFYGSL